MTINHLKTTLLTACLLSATALSAQNWNEIIKASASDRSSGDEFGYSVAISGDYAVVGTHKEDEDVSGGNSMDAAGSAYIFQNSAGTWSQVQKIVASDRSTTDYFGYSVAISGDFVVIGAFLEDEDASGGNTKNNAGSAYIFQNSAGTWTQVQKIVASDRAENDWFGRSVSISGDYIVIGALYEDEDASGGNTLNSSGSAYVFQNIAGTWSQVQKIVASDRATNDLFGNSVSISGDFALVGAHQEDEDASNGNTLASAGSAYIFQNIAGTWTQVQKIVASDRAAGDLFGYSVAISGDFAVMGAYKEYEDAAGGNSMNEAGSAYIFQNIAGTWTEMEKIVASDRSVFVWFGYSVAISGDYVVVGAYKESTDASGGNPMSESGSAYIFKNNFGTWTEVEKIVASDRAGFDWFGYSVAISGAHTIVGANKESEDASGGNTQPFAGSAYVFGLCTVTYGSDTQTACNSYTWIDGNTYTSSNNTATWTLTNAAGCDSVVMLNLTLNSVSDLTTSTSGITITANNLGASYQWLDCDNNNAVIVGETGQSFSPSSNGNYAVELTENGCIDTSACTAIATVGIIENSFGDELVVYPNPTNGDFSINLGSSYENAQVIITDFSGKFIESKNIIQTQVINLSIQEPAGVYLVSVQSGDRKVIIRLIKE